MIEAASCLWTNFTLKQVWGRNQRLLINLWWIFVLWMFLCFFSSKTRTYYSQTSCVCQSVSQIFTIKAFCQSNRVWHMIIDYSWNSLSATSRDKFLEMLCHFYFKFVKTNKQTQFDKPSTGFNGLRLGCLLETSSRGVGTERRINNKVSPVAWMGRKRRKKSWHEAQEGCQKVCRSISVIGFTGWSADVSNNLSQFINNLETISDEQSSALMCQQNKVFQYSWRLLSVQTHE